MSNDPPGQSLQGPAAEGASIPWPVLLCFPAGSALAFAIWYALTCWLQDKPIRPDDFTATICWTIPGIILAILIWSVPTRFQKAVFHGIWVGGVLLALTCGTINYRIDIRSGGWAARNPRTAIDRAVDASLGAMIAFQLGTNLGAVVAVILRASVDHEKKGTKLAKPCDDPNHAANQIEHAITKDRLI